MAALQGAEDPDYNAVIFFKTSPAFEQILRMTTGWWTQQEGFSYRKAADSWTLPSGARLCLKVLPTKDYDRFRGSEWDFM